MNFGKIIYLLVSEFFPKFLQEEEKREFIALKRPGKVILSIVPGMSAAIFKKKSPFFVNQEQT